MSCEANRIPRPVLAGLLNRKIKQNLAVTAVITSAGMLVFYWGYVLRRQKLYAEYYRQLDCEKEFEKMMATGVFDSCKRGGGDDKAKKKK